MPKACKWEEVERLHGWIILRHDYGPWHIALGEKQPHEDGVFAYWFPAYDQARAHAQQSRLNELWDEMEHELRALEGTLRDVDRTDPKAMDRLAAAVRAMKGEQ